MTSDEIYKLIEDNGLTLHGDIEHFAALIEQRTWVGLTDEEIYEAVKDKEGSPWRVIVDAIEAKLKEKNA
jgi:hypothetical protein